MRKINFAHIVSVLCFCAIALSACEKWQVATVSYESVGEVLNTIMDEAQSLCNRGELDEDVCKRIREDYNIARDIYIEAGDVLVDAMKLEDAAQKAAKMGKYRELVSGIGPFVRDVIELLRASGINTDKIKSYIKA
jgi:hypothetical protein